MLIGISNISRIIKYGSARKSTLIHMGITYSKYFFGTSNIYGMANVEKSKAQFTEKLNKLLTSAKSERKGSLSSQFKEFTKIFDRFLTGKKYIDWDKLESLPKDTVIQYSKLEQPSSTALKKLLSQLVVVKLNGGLGTSMGCKGPKSLLVVRDNKTFLHLTLEHLMYFNDKYKVNVPLILMNSFNTDEDTVKIIEQYGDKLKTPVHTFNQSAYPRIHKDTYIPMPKSGNIEEDKDAWYPPGHGDFYTSFQLCGLLDKYMKEGRKVCFISNIDNLGATVDMKILKFMLEPQGKKHEFIMELTEKTKSDTKGGTLMQYEGKTGLLEIAQVPKEHEKDFKDIKVFKYFNTNNLWIDLKAIKRVVDENKLDMEVIANEKEMKNGTKVWQLETAMGAAIRSFTNAIGVNTPRRRFLPVKKTSDLLLVMSNIYVLQNGTLVMSKKKTSPSLPIIKLDDEYFKKVDKFLPRFANMPNMLELERLTVSGNVFFGKDVTLKGTVTIIANKNDVIYIPDCAILEDKIVSGNLKIIKPLDV